MKVYVSADIEGCAGIAAAAESNMATPGDYAPFRQQMAAEVRAACEGAVAAGATLVTVKDAHASGRNLLPGDLALERPDSCRIELIRGWSGHPLAMVQELDGSFDAVLCIGYHAGAGQAGNPLAHTISGRLFADVALNDTPASELRLYALAAGTVGVPVALVTGDAAICAEARALIPGVATETILEGIGPSVRSLGGDEAVRRIRSRAEAALRGSLPAPLVPSGPQTLTLRFHHAAEAYARSFYPGVIQTGARELVLASDDYRALLTFLRFATRSV